MPRRLTGRGAKGLPASGAGGPCGAVAALVVALSLALAPSCGVVEDVMFDEARTTTTTTTTVDDGWSWSSNGSEPGVDEEVSEDDGSDARYGDEGSNGGNAAAEAHVVWSTTQVDSVGPFSFTSYFIHFKTQTIGDDPEYVMEVEGSDSYDPGDERAGVQETAERRALIDELRTDMQAAGWREVGQGSEWYQYLFARD